MIEINKDGADERIPGQAVYASVVVQSQEIILSMTISTSQMYLTTDDSLSPIFQTGTLAIFKMVKTVLIPDNDLSVLHS